MISLFSGGIIFTCIDSKIGFLIVILSIIFEYNFYKCPFCNYRFDVRIDKISKKNNYCPKCKSNFN